MGSPRQYPRRIGRREADRLLSGAPAGNDRPELARLLEAVSGPGLREELAEEPAAVALFGRQYELGRADAARGGVRPPRTRRARPGALRLAVALAVLLFGGLATGAETGFLPAALQRPAHSLFSALGVPPARARTSPGGRGSATPSPAPDATRTGTRAVPGVSVSGSAGPSVLAALCRAYDAGSLQPGSAEIAVLRTAAGGTGKIESFCAALLAAPATGQPGSAATTPGNGNAHPGKTKTHGPPSPKASHK